MHPSSAVMKVSLKSYMFIYRRLYRGSWVNQQCNVELSPLISSTSAFPATNETWQQMCKLGFKWLCWVLSPVCPCHSALSSSPFSSLSATWFPPIPSLMAARSDSTPRIYQAALILKLINNSDKTALSSACKDGRQSKEKLKEINSPLFLQHLNTQAPSLPHITLHCQILDIRSVFNWGLGGDGRNMGRVRELACWDWEEAHRPKVKPPKRW